MRVLPILVSAGFDSSRRGGLRVALLDTDFLLNRVRDSMNPAAPVLLGLSGVQLRQYASQHVFNELYGDDNHGHPTKWHKLSDQAEAAGDSMPPSAFQERFEARFLPYITFVEMGDLFADHPLAVAVRSVRNGKGASDGPTAQLAVLLSRLRLVAYSHDEHLYKAGVAPRPRYLLAVRQAEQDVSQGEQVQVAVSGIGVGSIVGIDYVVRAIGGQFGSPAWLTRLLAVGAGVWALWSPQRRAAVRRNFGPIGEFIIEHLAKAENGLRYLDEHVVNVEPNSSIESRIAEALVVRSHSGPLLARDIQDELRIRDPTLVDVPSIDELRGVLTSTACFEKSGRWRYTLGHRYRASRS